MALNEEIQKIRDAVTGLAQSIKVHGAAADLYSIARRIEAFAAKLEARGEAAPPAVVAQVGAIGEPLTVVPQADEVRGEADTLRSFVQRLECECDPDYGHRCARCVALSATPQPQPAAGRCPHGVRHPHPCRECEDASPQVSGGGDEVTQTHTHLREYRRAELDKDMAPFKAHCAALSPTQARLDGGEVVYPFRMIDDTLTVHGIALDEVIQLGERYAATIDKRGMPRAAQVFEALVLIARHTHPTPAPDAVGRLVEGWIADGDTIPDALIEETRKAIMREFGNNGTDGYYKRILVRVFRALTAAQKEKPQ